MLQWFTYRGTCYSGTGTGTGTGPVEPPILLQYPMSWDSATEQKCEDEVKQQIKLARSAAKGNSGILPG